MPPKKSSDHKSSRRIPARARKRKAPPQEASAKKRIQAKQWPSAGVRRANVGALFEALVALQARLRAPNGCPWDREQTHDSLRTYLVEETYEVLDALDSGDPRKLAGELGDVLLQVVFHAELGAEAGRFDIADVIESMSHEDGDAAIRTFSARSKARTSAAGAEELGAAQGRRAARGAKGNAGQIRGADWTALLRFSMACRARRRLCSKRTNSRAARRNVGFDWQNIEGLFEKLAEESVELRQALDVEGSLRREEEVGDLLFVGVNLARFLGLDAEIALKRPTANSASASARWSAGGRCGAEIPGPLRLVNWNCCGTKPSFAAIARPGIRAQ